MRYGYLVVEGPHDLEFIVRILRHHGLRRVQQFSATDPFWAPLIPRSFPPNDDLLARVSVSAFVCNNELSVAISTANSDTRLVSTLEETLALVTGIEAIGLVLDADSTHTPAARFAAIEAALQSRCSLPTPRAPREIAPGAPRVGAYVLPDNQAPGTLEDILLECADVEYRSLLTGARQFVDSVDRSVLHAADLSDLQKPAGLKKAITGCIASILRPGKAIQVSIHDNRWVGAGAFQLPRVAALHTFLAELLGLPPA